VREALSHRKYPCPFDTCNYRLVAKGETVMKQGEPGTEAYVVERGNLDVRRDGAGTVGTAWRSRGWGRATGSER